MSTGPVDAVGELLRTRRMRIWLSDAVSYTARAPCLLQQLEEALGLGSESGGRGIPSSRPLVNVEAWDLYTHIVTATNAWAQHYKIDPRPYRREGTTVPEPSRLRERTPPWMAALAPWARPVAWDRPPERLVADRVPDAEVPEITPLSWLLRAAAPNAAPVPIDDRAPGICIPAVGRLLRAAAAETVARGDDAVATTITRLAKSWARHIRGLLRQLEVQERVWPIRGAVCGQCGATTAIQHRHDGCEEYCPAARCRYHDGCPEHCVAAHCRYHVPAVEMRLAPLLGEDGQADDETLRAYRVCIACGADGWLPYSTATGRVDAA